MGWAGPRLPPLKVSIPALLIFPFPEMNNDPDSQLSHSSTNPPTEPRNELIRNQILINRKPCDDNDKFNFLSDLIIFPTTKREFEFNRKVFLF